MGDRLITSLKRNLKKLDVVSDVRGLGLFIGIELKLDLEMDYFELMFLLKECFMRKQILVQIELPMIIITPPINIDKRTTDEISRRLIEAIEDFQLEINKLNITNK
jgi:4-aminobutyrate aminotransferase-like enzyme